MRTNTLPLGQLLKMAINQMTRELTRSAADLGLTAQQMLILNFMGDYQAQSSERTAPSLAQIEEEFNIRRSTTTEILQRMEKAGLITRQPDPADARKLLIGLTGKGRSLLPAIRAAMQEHDKAALTSLTDSEIAAVHKFLTNISQDGSKGNQH